MMGCEHRSSGKSPRILFGHATTSGTVLTLELENQASARRGSGQCDYKSPVFTLPFAPESLLLAQKRGARSKTLTTKGGG